MESERSHSTTLPRSFHFHFQEQPPRTPEPTTPAEDSQPPPPPRPVLKIRRRRTTTVSIHTDFFDEAAACPIPTIEAPELYSESSIDLPTMPESLNNDYLSPTVSFAPLLSPPKTPISQIRSLDACPATPQWSEMGRPVPSDTSSRPTSSAGYSDSSLSSRGSFDSYDSYRSFDGSCTSPEEEKADPFPLPSASKHQLPSSPIAPHRSSVPKMKIKLRTTFTEDMDNHLWMTYMKYLQDPTVTPFKALPSTVPPNGVCHRVARMARKTWKGPRAVSLTIPRPASRYDSRCGTPDTIKPAKSGSCTPVPRANRPYLRFPSEKQCRKRLRDLAKQKPSLSAHYQRMLRRSPSPLLSSPPREQEPPQPQHLSSPFSQETSSFSIRDMNVSLATSTATTMQLGNPLSQLATESTPRPSDDWAKARVSAHQKSQSLHISLGLSSMLGSSFARMSEMTDSSFHQHNAQTWHAPTAVPPRLGSPLQLHSPRPISRPFRRRALHNFEEQVRDRTESFVDQVFGAPAESSHRGVRSRGFSLGDMMAGARRLPSYATAPPHFNPFANIAEVPGPQRPEQESRIAQGNDIVRLGSPFNAKPGNTFPRAATSYGYQPAANFASRFAEYSGSPDQ